MSSNFLILNFSYYAKIYNIYFFIAYISSVIKHVVKNICFIRNFNLYILEIKISYFLSLIIVKCLKK